jgi:iron complex outermembrane receptor protein
MKFHFAVLFTALGLLARQSPAQDPTWSETLTPADSAAAQPAPVPIASGDTTVNLEKEVVKGRRSEKSEYVSKLPLKRVENPQVYNTIDSRILKEQIATSVDDALKNAPGVYRLWEPTGRGGDGASYYALRGFEAQPTMLNGLPGVTNGGMDPANVDRIEVIKGPSGTLFGSSLISYGGLINTVTKKPGKGFFGEASIATGSFGMNRVTADANVPLSASKDVALRLITAYHSENSFQDAGFRKSFFVAPSLAYQVNERLSFLISAEFMSAEVTNPAMLFLNRSKPVDFKDLNDLNYNNKLSLTGNDLSIKNPRLTLQGQMNYKLGEEWTSQSIVGRGSAESEGYYSYLWNESPRTFSLFVSDQEAKTVTSSIQQNFIGDFNLGILRNRMVLGADYFLRNAIDNGSGYAWVHNVTPQGAIDYVNPFGGDTVQPRALSRQTVDSLLVSAGRSLSNVTNETYSAYVSDVVNVTKAISAMASLRVDYFKTDGDISTQDDDYDQVALSPKFGLVYQPLVDRLALFANYMNGFKNVAPVIIGDISGGTPTTKTFKPEHADQIEAGVKTDLLANRLSSTVSYYYIHVVDKVMQDPSDINNMVQGGEIESKGLEVELNAGPFAGFNLLAGYSFNECLVIQADETNIFAVAGRRPVDAGPEHLFNLWATYEVPAGLLKGFGIGAGANAASELQVLDNAVTGRFYLPDYAVFRSSLFYNTKDFSVTLAVENLLDEEYYSGYSTINPQKPRNVAAAFSYRF